MSGPTRSLGRCGATLGALMALAGSSQADSRHPTRPRFLSPTALSIGAPSEGSLVSATQLRPNPHITIKHGSEPVTWGHPELVSLLERTAERLRDQRHGYPLLIGDLSSKHGGLLHGHRSHQSGRDVDIGFSALDESGRPKRLHRFQAFAASGYATDGSGVRFDDYRNFLLVFLLATDESVDVKFIFIAPALRYRLIRFAQSHPVYKYFAAEVAAVLYVPHDVEPHDDHFHVRIACPERDQGLCTDESWVQEVEENPESPYQISAAD